MQRADRDACIHDAFSLISRTLGSYPDLTVHDDGKNELFVNGFRCILASDDDGFFYFHPWNEVIKGYDTQVTIRIPYPE